MRCSYCAWDCSNPVWIEQPETLPEPFHAECVSFLDSLHAGAEPWQKMYWRKTQE